MALLPVLAVGAAVTTVAVGATWLFSEIDAHLEGVLRHYDVFDLDELKLAGNSTNLRAVTILKVFCS